MNLEPPVVPPDHKWCAKCNRALPKSSFGKNNARPDKLGLYCRECNREYQRARVVRDPVVTPRTAAVMPVVEVDPTWGGVYGPENWGFAGGHVCSRCCEWKVNSYFSEEDICVKCAGEREEVRELVMHLFDEPIIEIDPSVMRRLRLVSSPALAARLVAGFDAAHLLAIAEQLPAGAVRDHLVELSIGNDTPAGMLSLQMLESYFPTMPLAADKILRWEAAGHFPRREIENPPLWRQELIDAWYARTRR